MPLSVPLKDPDQRATGTLSSAGRILPKCSVVQILCAGCAFDIVDGNTREICAVSTCANKTYDT